MLHNKCMHVASNCIMNTVIKSNAEIEVISLQSLCAANRCFFFNMYHLVYQCCST